METFSKIHRYELTLFHRATTVRNPYVIFAITDSLDIAERLVRLEYPSLMMYSVSTIQKFTIAADNCSEEDSVFNFSIKAGNEHKMEIEALIVTRSITEAIKICLERYRVTDIKEIKIVQMNGVVLSRGSMGIEG